MLTPVSIRTRLTLLFAGLLFLSLVLFGVTTVRLLRNRLTERAHDSLARRIQGVENFLRRETTEQTAHMIPEEIAEYAFTQPEGHLIEVIDDKGKTLLRSEPAPSPSISQEEDFAIYGRTYRVRAWASLAGMERTLADLRWLMIGMTPFLLIGTAAVGYWIASRAFAPVDEMTTLARSIGLADLSRRIPVSPARDELSRLAEAWNEMLARLESSVARIQRFTADAAHELRTPLTALRTTAELAIRRRRDPGQYQEALAEVATIASRMAEQLEQLLSLARGDSSGPASPEPVSLGEITSEVCRSLQPLFDSAKVNLAVHVDADLARAPGDPAALRRLMTALMENAVKYTASGGTVTVSVRRDRSGQVWEIADTGCGIPEESIPHIFDRFYRADASRDRRTGGYGLGLAIADQIARQHNTRIEVRSQMGEGTTFFLRFPASPELG